MPESWRGAETRPCDPTRSLCSFSRELSPWCRASAWALWACGTAAIPPGVCGRAAPRLRSSARGPIPPRLRMLSTRPGLWSLPAVPLRVGSDATESCGLTPEDPAPPERGPTCLSLDPTALDGSFDPPAARSRLWRSRSANPGRLAMPRSDWPFVMADVSCCGFGVGICQPGPAACSDEPVGLGESGAGCFATPAVDPVDGLCGCTASGLRVGDVAPDRGTNRKTCGLSDVLFVTEGVELPPAGPGEPPEG